MIRESGLTIIELELELERLVGLPQDACVPRKSTFRYNSMFNFIPVSFSFCCCYFRVRVSYRVNVRFGVRVRVRVPDR